MRRNTPGMQHCVYLLAFGIVRALSLWFQLSFSGKGMASGRLLTIPAVFLGHYVCSPENVSASDELETLIQNIEKNEKLYLNLEVRWKEIYDIGDRQDETLSPKTYTRHRESVFQCVLQNGLFRINRDSEILNVSGKQSSRATIRSYDGELTRLIWVQDPEDSPKEPVNENTDEDPIVNIIHARAEQGWGVRPHMMLKEMAGSFPFTWVPLSVYFRGLDAIVAARERSPHYHDKRTMQIAYEGEAEFNGHACRKVSVTSVPHQSKAPTHRWEFWLAEDRNYIPVRLLTYNSHASADAPASEAVITEFRELESGVWFPYAAEKTSYDRHVMEYENRIELQWTRNILVKEASLNPSYDLSHFRDIEFPDGAMVYEIGSDQEVIRSYRQGEFERSLKFWGSLLALIILLICVMLLIVWRVRTRRSRN